MQRSYQILSLIAGCLLFAGTVLAQENASRFDYGKMWTFEHAPLEYFEKTYGFTPTEEWLEKARMSALRFSSFCSASFISPDGLILTNHHCSRPVVGALMKEGEDFDEEGFYATTQAEERRAEGLFVKQLVKIADITEAVKAASQDAANEAELTQLEQQALEQIKNEYTEKADWKDLELETVTYYSGGKYSLYGYKRYDDIRLVLLPELQLGFYGGDPDNFTYPRYNLDFTIWRAYENGKPANTSGHYFPMDAKGAMEDEPVFVIGNPGSTERYRTVAQLEYDRDYRYKIQLESMHDAVEIMEMQYEENPSHELKSNIFSMQNGIKAISGIVEGLHNAELMGRKIAMEKYVKSRSMAVKEGRDFWQEIDEAYDELEEEIMELNAWGPNGRYGNTIIMAHLFSRYYDQVKAGAAEDDLEAMSNQLIGLSGGLSDPYEVHKLTAALEMAQKYADSDDTYVAKMLQGRSPRETAEMMLEKTVFSDSTKLRKLLSKEKKMEKGKDPIIQFSEWIVPEYMNAVMEFRSSTPTRRGLEQRVANEVFKIYGLDIPPDATFTLRLADGVVKGYEYNGTVAPYKTTYFGLYDRHYSHGQEFPWSLPDRWKNPTMGLLKSPLNFVSTNDIIGGNSGSPIIDKDLQLVGLVFDGNIESLPGNFIYEPTTNRAVHVHAGGIMAAIKHVYKADRVLEELMME